MKSSLLSFQFGLSFGSGSDCPQVSEMCCNRVLPESLINFVFSVGLCSSGDQLTFAAVIFGLNIFYLVASPIVDKNLLRVCAFSS